jgi:Kef-type K+ transport system membrane component KefB
MLASSETVDLARILLDLLLILAAAKLGAELAERIRVPAVLGEIAAGIVLGPSATGLLHIEGGRGVSVAVLAEIGVLLLLVQVGMEMDLGELRKVGRASMLVAVIGVVLPFVGGAVAGVALGHGAKTAVFLGAALTATSVGITARVFGDLHALATVEARVVIGAAVADDVLGLVILTVVVKVVSGGSVDVGTVAGTLGLATLFLIGTGVVGLLVVPRLLDGIHRFASSGATVVVAAIGVILAFAELADLAKLAFIIGAFMAGLAVAKSSHHERIATDLGAVGSVLIPIFFVQIGVNADLSAMARPSVLGLAAVLTVIGVIGKVVAGWGAVGTRADRFLVGLGMIPRGEVGLIFASIGLSNGVLDKDLYGALLVVVLVTTVITPPMLRQRIGSAGRRRGASEEPAAEVEPVDGWLRIAGGQIELRATPPVTATVRVALDTAQLLDEAEPSDGLLDWFAAHRHAPLAWDPDDDPDLARLLRRSDMRAWRLLEAIGVFERALPEIESAIRRRRSDVRALDPAASLRLPTVEGLRHLATHGVAHDSDLVFAALAIDVAEDAARGRPDAEALLRRLGRHGEADRVLDLVTDAHILREAALRPASFEEPALLQLAAHLADAVHARQAYTLARAMGEPSRRLHDSLEELVGLILDLLDHPEVSGPDAGNLAGARLRAAQSLADSVAVADRLRHASTTFLLSQDPVELARQARLLEPLPRSGIVRVAVTPDPEPDLWRIEVACRDTPGLLARLAGVLADEGLSVAYAAIATWPDGAVLDSFMVSSRTRPQAKHLALRMERALKRPIPSRAMPMLQVEFDDDAMPWHTVCVVTGPDMPGTLEAVAAAFAAADTAIHTARIQTIDGQISDRFTISDRVGRKIDEPHKERIRRALRGDKVGGGRLRRLVGAS